MQFFQACFSPVSLDLMTIHTQQQKHNHLTNVTSTEVFVGQISTFEFAEVIAKWPDQIHDIIIQNGSVCRHIQGEAVTTVWANHSQQVGEKPLDEAILHYLPYLSYFLKYMRKIHENYPQMSSQRNGLHPKLVSWSIDQLQCLLSQQGNFHIYVFDLLEQ